MATPRAARKLSRRRSPRAKEPVESLGSQARSLAGISRRAATQDDSQFEFPYETQQVIDVFEGEGVPLYKERLAAGLHGDVLDVPSSDVEQVADEYGYFLVYVVTNQATLDALLSDRQGNPIQPDADGIYWKLSTVQAGTASFDSWSASKPFKNVVLWWVAGRDKETDETWDRLNAVLEKLPQ